MQLQPKWYDAISDRAKLIGFGIRPPPRPAHQPAREGRFSAGESWWMFGDDVVPSVVGWAGSEKRKRTKFGS